MFTTNLPPRSQPQSHHLYDVAVVGAGLAGCEVAWRLARAGRDVLLVSQALDTLGNLYQPADDPQAIPQADFAPGSLFAQVRQNVAAAGGSLESWAFHRHLKAELEGTSGIHLLQSCITGLDETGDEVALSSWEGPTLRASKVVLAVGAFLKGRLLMGDTLEEAGRLSEVAYDFLADDLAAHGLYLGYDSGSAQLSSAPESAHYEVRFQVLTGGELADNGFALRRLDHTYALGRCVAGTHTYRSVLDNAASLVRLLLGEGGTASP